LLGVTPIVPRQGLPLAASLTIAAAGVAAGAVAARPPEAVRLVDHRRGLAGPWRVKGYLLTDPQSMAPNAGLDLAVEAIWVDGGWRRWPLRVRTTVYEPPVSGLWSAGDGFEAFLALRADRPPRNPGVPPRAELRASGVDLRSSLKSFRQLRRRPSGLAGGLRAFLAPARDAIRRASVSLFAGEGPYVRALILGERGDIPAPVMERFARTGLVHLLAISGLHVGLVVGIAFFALGATGLARPHAAAVCVAALPLLNALVVPRPAVQRASLMAAAVLTGIASGRRTAPLNGLAIASIVLAMADPWTTRDLGFQLSTAATAAILLAAVPGTPGGAEDAGGRDAARARGARRVLRAVACRAGDGLGISCAAQLGVTPILAAATLRLPWTAAVLNIVAVPLLGTVLALILVTLAVAALGLVELARWPAAAAIGGLQGLRSLAALADRPGAALAVSAAILPLLVAAGAVGIGLAAVARLGFPSPGRAAARRSAPIAACGLLLAFAGLLGAPRDDVDAAPVPPLRLIAFDIGQGDSLLVETPGRETVLIDTGGSPVSNFDPGPTILAPALRARGVRALDVAISHFHADHAGGLAGLARELPVDEIWMASPPPPSHPGLDASAATRLALTAGHERRAGPCLWKVLHPPAIWSAAGANDLSLVLLLRCGRRALLLTGDSEAAAERAWARPGLMPEAGVLKVPHHGSRTSSGPPLLEAVGSRHALISVGWKNRFGHPHEEVLESYRRRQIAVYRTDRDGAVSFELGSRIRVRGERWTAGRGRYSVGGWLP
jgi:competence protein ComEC